MDLLKILQQTSTVVIIYDEPVGIKEDEVIFIFPGEVSGGPMKKVVPERIDSRTFVIETPSKSSKAPSSGALPAQPL